MKIKDLYSPNFNKKPRSKKSIKLVIFHYTGMQSERESINKLCNKGSKVSSHYLINEYGKIFSLVKERHVAWHAGHSKWKKTKNLNQSSIGIELVNKGHKWGYKNFKKKQILNLKKLCKKLKIKYKIKSINFLGHSDIAPTRKIDPGEKFPWEYLAKQKIGIWHDLKNKKLKKLKKNPFVNKKEKQLFIENLKKIGYLIYPSLKKRLLIKVIRAFQRHFRRDLINGIIDKECLLITQNLIQKIKKIP